MMVWGNGMTRRTRIVVHPVVTAASPGNGTDSPIFSADTMPHSFGQVQRHGMKSREATHIACRNNKTMRDGRCGNHSTFV